MLCFCIKAGTKDSVAEIVAESFYFIIGKFDIRRTLDKKSPRKSGHRKQTID